MTLVLSDTETNCLGLGNKSIWLGLGKSTSLGNHAQSLLRLGKDH